MNTVLQVLPNLSCALSPGTLTQHGNNNTQIAQVNEYNDQSVNNTLVINTIPMQVGMGCVNQVQITFDNNFYNLFVVDDIDLNGSFFTIPKEKALTESVAKDIRSTLAILSPEAIEQVKSYPAIFASQNKSYGATDKEHLAYLGFISDVRVERTAIKVFFTKLNAFPQQYINERIADFGLEGVPAYNELDNTHWSVKNLNVVEVLRSAGFQIFWS